MFSPLQPGLCRASANCAGAADTWKRECSLVDMLERRDLGCYDVPFDMYNEVYIGGCGLGWRAGNASGVFVTRD